MKAEHKDEPESQLNIYVVNNNYMGLAGISYFPWCDDAIDISGGIIMDYRYVGGNADCGPGQDQRCTMLTHEIGHSLGLWHTHHGVSEVDECSNCYEYANGYQCSQRGDFCCDTAATPYNPTCSDPGGSDPCNEVSWGNTDEKNHMGLGPQGCADHFTPQQVRRMHCWVCNSDVAGWIDGEDCNDNDEPDICDITSGFSEDCDYNGVPEECETFVDCNENDIRDACDIAQGTDRDCDADGVLDDACEAVGACCLSAAPDDCVRTPTSGCCSALNGLNWYGLGSRCQTTDCTLGPMGPQGP